jgi:branched-chain amino acid aminotransferase
MINFNSNLIPKDTSIFGNKNRAFSYGDGVFETLKVYNSKIVFFEEHYFRLMASMRILRMEIPENFTLEYVENEILKTVKSNELLDFARIRMTVFRNDGGLYTPLTNNVSYVIEVEKLNDKTQDYYEVELFKDFYVNSSFLSTLKTTNRILNVVASIFASENDYHSCLLINEKKNLVEASQGNIFLVFGNELVTPPITDGCIKGIVRNKIIELLKKKLNFTVVERTISPFELQKADELFITNSIIDIQQVNKYRKKIFETVITSEIREILKESYS